MLTIVSRNKHKTYKRYLKREIYRSQQHAVEITKVIILAIQLKATNSVISSSWCQVKLNDITSVRFGIEEQKSEQLEIIEVKRNNNYNDFRILMSIKMKINEWNFTVDKIDLSLSGNTIHDTSDHIKWINVENIFINIISSENVDLLDRHTQVYL